MVQKFYISDLHLGHKDCLSFDERPFETLEEITKYFVWVKDYAEIKDNDRNIVLCHYPIAHWRNADYGYVHLYGHIHTGRDTRPFDEYASLMKSRGTPYECFNVGCMLPYMDYTPRTLDEIITANANKE